MASQQERVAVDHSSTYWTNFRPASAEVHPPSRWSPAPHQYSHGAQAPQFGAPPRPTSRPSLPLLDSATAPRPGFQHPHAHSYAPYQHLGSFSDESRKTTPSPFAPTPPFGGGRAAPSASASIVRDHPAGPAAPPPPRYSIPPSMPHPSFPTAHPLQSTSRPPSIGSAGGASRFGVGGPGQPLREADVTAMMWDDEGVLCYTVLVGDNVIGRRFDNGWVNSTKMLNIIGLSRGKRDGLLKHEEQRLVIRRGSKQLKGVWLPLPRARHLAESQGITNDIYPILEDNIEPFLFMAVNRSRTQQLVDSFAAQRHSREVQALKLSNETHEQHTERLRKLGVLGTTVAAIEKKLEETRSQARPVRRSSGGEAGRRTSNKMKSPAKAAARNPVTEREKDKNKAPPRLASAPTSLPSVPSSHGVYFNLPPHYIQYGRDGPSLSPTQSFPPPPPVDLASVFLDDEPEETEPFVFYNNVTPQSQAFAFASRRASMVSEMGLVDGDGVGSTLASNEEPVGFDPQVFSKVPLPSRRHSFPQLDYTPRFNFPFDQDQADEEARQPSPQNLERASRMSIDSAACFLFPGVGLGPTSIVAPSTVLYAPDPSFAHPPQPHPPPPSHSLDPPQAFSPPYPSPISSSAFFFPPQSPSNDCNAGDHPGASNRPPTRPQHLLRRRSTFSPEHEQIDEGVVLESPTSQYNPWSVTQSPPPPTSVVDESFSFPAFPTSLAEAKSLTEQGTSGAQVEIDRPSSTVGLTLVGPRARKDSVGAVVSGSAAEDEGSAEQGMSQAGVYDGFGGAGKRAVEWDIPTGEHKRPKLNGRRASVA